MGRTTTKFTYTDGSYFCNACDSPHEGESLAESCFDAHERRIACPECGGNVWATVTGRRLLDVEGDPIIGPEYEGRSTVDDSQPTNCSDCEWSGPIAAAVQLEIIDE